MRILILESVSCLHGEADHRLLSEGFAMLRTMTKEFREAGFDVLIVLNKKIEKFAEWLDADVFLNRSLNGAIEGKPDAALVIAPEKGGELEQIVEKLGKKGITVFNAGRDVLRISSDKWLTYLALKRKVPQPKTWRTPPKIKDQILVKPVDGVGCEGIRFFSSNSCSGEMIFQKFIDGEHASCCLLMGRGKGKAR